MYIVQTKEEKIYCLILYYFIHICVKSLLFEKGLLE
jgi:hypothetical protein